MDKVTLINNILVGLIWPVFLFVLFLKADQLLKVLDIVLGPLSKTKGIEEMQLFGQKVKFTSADIEKKLEIDLKKLETGEKGSSPIPYTSSEETERIVFGIHTLDLFNFATERIENLAILKCMGGYYYMIRELDRSLDYYQIAEQIAEKQSIEDLDIYCNLGFLHLLRKDYTKADKCFKKAGNVDQDFPWADLGRGMVYQLSRVNSENHESYLQSAIKKFEKLLESQPMDYLSHFGMATTYHFWKKHEKALTHLDKSIDRNPTFALGYYNRAIDKLKCSYSTEEAILDLQKAITLNPKLRLFAICDNDLKQFQEDKCFKCLVKQEM